MPKVSQITSGYAITARKQQTRQQWKLGNLYGHLYRYRTFITRLLEPSRVNKTGRAAQRCHKGAQLGGITGVNARG